MFNSSLLAKSMSGPDCLWDGQTWDGSTWAALAWGRIGLGADRPDTIFCGWGVEIVCPLPWTSSLRQSYYAYVNKVLEYILYLDKVCFHNIRCTCTCNNVTQQDNPKLKYKILFNLHRVRGKQYVLGWGEMSREIVVCGWKIYCYTRKDHCWYNKQWNNCIKKSRLFTLCTVSYIYIYVSDEHIQHVKL